MSKEMAYSKETRDAIDRGIARGQKVVPGGAAGVARKVVLEGAIAKSFKIPGQKKAVKVINGWAVNGARELTKKVRGSWK